MATNSHRFLKANLLSFAIVGGSLASGLLLGLWVIPVVLVLLSDGKLSLSDFPLEAHVFPHAPSDGVMRFPPSLRNAIDYAGAMLSVAGIAGFGWAGTRYNHYLIVKKFRWLTQKEAMSTEKFRWL
jgi:hypothetical protein